MNLALLAPVIALLVVGAAALVLRVQRSQQAHLVGRVLEPAVAPGRQPSILYFTGEACTICHTAQRPALQRLEAALPGQLKLREIDVAAEPEMARRYRVMSLPTTVVLAANGEVVAVNAGFAAAERLQEQLHAAARQHAA